MVLTCKEIWREVSNYLDDSMPSKMRNGFELHLRRCPRCVAVVDGVRNVIVLAGDERVFALPAGFGVRLQARLKTEL